MIHKIRQTADSLGRTLDNLGKDIRTVASSVAGVGDSAEVYAMTVSSQQLSVINKNKLYVKMAVSLR